MSNAFCISIEANALQHEHKTIHIRLNIYFCSFHKLNSFCSYFLLMLQNVYILQFYSYGPLLNFCFCGLLCFRISSSRYCMLDPLLEIFLVLLEMYIFSYNIQHIWLTYNMLESSLSFLFLLASKVNYDLFIQIFEFRL